MTEQDIQRLQEDIAELKEQLKNAPENSNTLADQLEAKEQQLSDATENSSNNYTATSFRAG